MRKYVAEFIGTFFLVLVVGCTGIAAVRGVIPPIAIGSVLMVMIYAGGHVSGAHYNPAVTLGVCVRGRCTVSDLVAYWIVQAVAACAAAATAGFLRAGSHPVPLVAATGPAFVAEALFTFALVYVVLNSATAKATSGNSFYGLAIGFTVLVGAFAVGDISGGAFNPAVAIGASIMRLLSWSQIWLYFVAELAGGLAAGLTFKVLNPADV